MATTACRRACTAAAMATAFSCYGQIERTLWIDPEGVPQDEINIEDTNALDGTVESCGG